MTTLKVVTDGQLKCVRKMATDKRVDKVLFETRGLNGGIISKALEAIKLGRRIRIVPEIKAPEGGRIYTVRVRVVLDRPWQGAINAAGPNTPDNFDVRKVGELYLPTGTGIVESEQVLVNFGQRGGSFSKAIEWGEQYSLKRTDPRRVFAIAEYRPQLHYELGTDPMFVVAMQDCTLKGGVQACSVWWDGAEREARLDWVGSFGSPHDWFAFASD